MENFKFVHLESIKQKGTFVTPLKKAKISYISIHDIAAVAAEVLLSNNHKGKVLKEASFNSYIVLQIFTLTGPKALKQDEIAELFTKILGKDVIHTYKSLAEFKQTEISETLPNWISESMLELYKHQEKNGLGSTATDHVEQILNRPALSFEDWIASELRTFGGIVWVYSF